MSILSKKLVLCVGMLVIGAFDPFQVVFPMYDTKTLLPYISEQVELELIKVKMADKLPMRPMEAIFADYQVIYNNKNIIGSIEALKEKYEEKAHDVEFYKYKFETPNYEGLTLLHVAAAEQNVPLVNWLFKQGADPSLKTANGNTALDVAHIYVIKGLQLGDEKGVQRAINTGLAVLDFIKKNASKLQQYEDTFVLVNSYNNFKKRLLTIKDQEGNFIVPGGEAYFKQYDSIFSSIKTKASMLGNALASLKSTLGKLAGRLSTITQ